MRALAIRAQAGQAVEQGRPMRGKIVLYEEWAPMRTEVARAGRTAELVAEMPTEPLVEALRRITRVLSGTLELREVFARVSEAAASVLPLDFMAVVRVREEGALEL